MLVRRTGTALAGHVWWAIGRAFVGFFLPFVALAAFACALVTAYTQTTEVAAVVVDHSASAADVDSPSNYYLEVRAISGSVYDLRSTDSDLDLLDGQQVILDVSTSNGQVEHLRTETRSVGFEWDHAPLVVLAVLASLSPPWIMLVLALDERRNLGYWAAGVVLAALAAVAAVLPFFLL